MAFISRLKQLPQGTRRLLVFISICLFLLLSVIAIGSNSVGLLVLSFLSFFIFWIAVWAILWIQDGYKHDREE